MGLNVAHWGRARGSCSWRVVGKGREERDAQVVQSGRQTMMTGPEGLGFCFNHKGRSLEGFKQESSLIQLTL